MSMNQPSGASNWKTSLAGLLGALLMLFGNRLTGVANAPPITAGNAGAAVAVATLGIVAKDASNKS